MDAIDLHVHSTFSDGTLTPSELVSRAKQFHLAAMALTDHDTIEGIPEAVQAAREQNLELVPGVELSTFWDEKEIHIVGLFIDYTDKTFQKELESLRDVRRNRNITMCEKFTQLGIPIDYSDMEKEYADAVITRAHFADYASFLLHGNGQRNTNPNAVMRISPSPYRVRITLLWWT